MTVDGRVVTELGTKADPARARIAVDGRPIALGVRRYILVNKPRGVVSTRRDPQGRRTALDVVGKAADGLYPVGRLDLDSEGLLLLTNDGELTHLLTHSRHRVEKTYEVEVKGVPPKPRLDALRSGVELEEGRTAPAKVRLMWAQGGCAGLRVTIGTGWKRQIRRMLEEVGHPVVRLRRVAMGPLELGGLAPGRWRPLTPREVEALRQAAKVVSG